MTPTLTPPPAPAAPPGVRFADRLAPVLFALAFVHLLAVAGLIHRADQIQVTGVELQIMLTVLVVLWPVFAAEAVLAYLRRDRSRRRGPILLRVLAVCLCPPARLGFIHPATGMIWLPRLGWQPPGRPLLARLDRAFDGPMLAFAFLILPVLAVEYVGADTVQSSPALAAAVHVGVAVIWVAFAVEFILKVSAAPSAVGYVKERWIDLAIVVLPTLEFVLNYWADAGPVARLLRTTRAVAPDQLARMGRLYRLRGLMAKGWQALLAFGVLARLIGDTPKKRLQRLEGRIDALEDELAELRRQADAIRDQLAKGVPPAGVPAKAK